MELGKTEGNTAHASNKANRQKITHQKAANLTIHHKRGIAGQTQLGVQSVRGDQTCSMQQWFFEPRLQTFALWETTGHFGLFSFKVCSVVVPEQGLLLLMLLLLLLLLPCKEFQGSVHQGGVIV